MGSLPFRFSAKSSSAISKQTPYFCFLRTRTTAIFRLRWTQTFLPKSSSSTIVKQLNNQLILLQRVRHPTTALKNMEHNSLSFDVAPNLNCSTGSIKNATKRVQENKEKTTDFEVANFFTKIRKKKRRANTIKLLSARFLQVVTNSQKTSQSNNLAICCCGDSSIVFKTKDCGESYAGIPEDEGTT